MRIQRAAPINELLAKLIFLVLPTIAMGSNLLFRFNQHNGIINNNYFNETIYWGAAMMAALVFYAFRFRFWPTIAALIIVLYSIAKGIDKMAIGEFDGLKMNIAFTILSIMIVLGWIMGWGFLRFRYWAVGVAGLFLSLTIFFVAKSNVDNVEKLLFAFSPAVLYAVYIIFTNEQIYSYKDKSRSFWWFLTRRIVLFSALLAMLLAGVYYFMDDEIKQTVDSYGGKGATGKNSMLRKNKDGTFDLEEYSKLRSQLGRSNELLFCAYIDNFFEGTDIPNPLYLTAFYYTKFDTSTETFEREKNASIPQNDLFEPDPSATPLFGTKYDSSVLKNSGTKEYGRTVEVQVFATKLSPHTYLAPHTGYFVQPITVEKGFRDSFKTAFRAKSFVSKLNSAYAVYNAKNPQIQAFQEERFRVLRKYIDYNGESKAFMDYYTFMPKDAKFNNIANLAQTVAGKATTPVDKVIAIRDYFLSKDPTGAPLFKYTDNPGIPDIPNASKLQYFLFENRKGYCAYFAGATLFMLRSLGIPSRIAVGFMTVDRSDKNKGWYWYYADQAHAWVQVYFPGIGWMDFDTTVGNDEANDSPTPDGTPPMQPPRAYLSINGVIKDIDTVAKTISIRPKNFVFKDKEYKSLDTTSLSVLLDVHIATIRKDSVEVPLTTIKKGEYITGVSYAEAFKNISTISGERGLQLLKRFPTPEPIDEVYVWSFKKKEPSEKPTSTEKEKENDWKRAAILMVSILGALILLFFLFPVITLLYYKWRAKNAKSSEKKAYWTYRAALFYLHQLGNTQGTLTAYQYANQQIDQKYGTDFATFMKCYLQQKYANAPLLPAEQQLINSFLPLFLDQVNKQELFRKRLWAFLLPLRTVNFFVKEEV